MPSFHKLIFVRKHCISLSCQVDLSYYLCCATSITILSILCFWTALEGAFVWMRVWSRVCRVKQGRGWSRLPFPGSALCSLLTTEAENRTGAAGFLPCIARCRSTALGSQHPPTVEAHHLLKLFSWPLHDKWLIHMPFMFRPLLTLLVNIICNLKSFTQIYVESLLLMPKKPRKQQIYFMWTTQPPEIRPEIRKKLTN